MPADNAVHSKDGRWTLLHWSGEGTGSIRLTHAPTERVVLDLTDPAINVESWRFSPDEALLFLRVSRRDGRVMSMPATIDLETGWYYYHPDPRQTHGPIGDVADLVESLMNAAPPPGRHAAEFVPRWIPKDQLDRPGTHVPDVRSPDGRFLIDLNSNAVRYSVVIHPVKIVEVATGDVLLDFWGTMFDTRARFEHGTGRLILAITRYPERDPSFYIAIDLEREVYWDPKGKPTDPPRGYLDELQKRLGWDESSNHVRANWGPTVRPSRRGPRPDPNAPVAKPMRWASVDGVWAMYLDEFEVRPGEKMRQARIEHAPSGENALDLRGSPWVCDGEFLEGCSQLVLTISDTTRERWVRVRIEMDCLLYWEDEGTMLGRPGGVQAGPLHELQSRLGASADEQARLGLLISTPRSRGPEVSRAVVLNEPAAAITPAGPPELLTDLLERAERLQLAREALSALRVAREVQAGRMSPEAGAAELARWLKP